MTTSAQTTNFKAAHPDVWEWLETSAARFEFAASLSNQVYRRGHLSDAQLAAARRCIAGAQAAKAREENAPDAEVALVEQAFARAKAAGLQRPKLTIAGLKFKPAPDHGVNAGAIYATQAADGLYLGKFSKGRFVRSRECDELRQAQLVSIAKDPLGAAVAHGKLTGGCAVCNRKLSDPVSVSRGIGPICAEKFGW